MILKPYNYVSHFLFLKTAIVRVEYVFLMPFLTIYYLILATFV
jgi:hypothetical protein